MNKGILFLVNTSLLILRGVERWTIMISNKLREGGFRVYVVSLSSLREEYVKDYKETLRRYFVVKEQLRDIPWLEVKSLDYTHVPRVFSAVRRFMKYSGLRVLISIENLVKLAKMLRNVDIVYLPVGSADQIINLTLYLILLGGVNKRIIYGLHARPNYRRFIFYLPLLKIFNKFGMLVLHAVNIEDYVILKRYLNNVVKVVYVPNFVDIKFFNPERGVKDNDVFQCLFVGALSYDKGADIVIELAKGLRRILGDQIRIIVSSTGGPLLNEFEEASKSGILEFRGFVDDSELVRLYASSHCVIAPSRDEAFGLVVLEALASGTPVITSSVPAFKVTVKDGYNGFSVLSFNSEDYVKAVLKIYRMWKEQPELYREMCLNARRVAEKFSIGKVSNIFIRRLLLD